jgi:hypothetical protein
MINEWKNEGRENSLNLKKYEYQERRGRVADIGCQMRRTGK